jgi:ParB family chromosome partitioning protein
MTLAALAEVGGPALAERYAKAKKTELAQACERIFSGDFIAEVEVKEAALAWVPEAMRFGSPAQPVEADDAARQPEAGSAPADEPEAGRSADEIGEAA